MHYSWVNRLYSTNRVSFDLMKCRHINIVLRVELQVSDYFVFVYSSSPHDLGNLNRVSPSCPISIFNIQAAARYMYHVSSSLLFYLPYACYYRYLTKVYDGQPFYLSEWKTALDTLPTIKWCGVEKFGILSEYWYWESIPNFSTPYHLMVRGVSNAVFHSLK